METANTKIIKETFQEISDLVTGTMGAKGRLAVLKQDMDRPLLTDDGVTVARKAYSMEGLKRLPAISMVEAASNTEKEAYDGTTLTVLLTNAFYQLGLKWIKPKILGGEGLHPQLAADKIERSATHIRCKLKKTAKKLRGCDVRNLATITTKIPAVGEIVESAYKLAGEQMNIVVEHDMNETETKVEHSEGIVLNSGYMSEVMRAFCNEKDKTVFTNAALVLLSEDMMSQTMLLNFIKSLPNEVPPLVFMITSKFNPESLKILLDLLVPNQKNG
jgi:Chaperonin GroEL (HSP60 family)